MKYKIKIDYKTGDSFNSYEESECIDGEWSDLKIVEENLERIHKHHEWYQDTNNRSWRRVGNQPKIEVPECVKISESWDSCGSIVLLTDEKVEYLIHPFWVGYFETLHSVSIEAQLPRRDYR